MIIMDFFLTLVVRIAYIHRLQTMFICSDCRTSLRQNHQ